MLALNTRLLISSGLVLAAFLGLTAVSLDASFRNNAHTVLQERLKTYAVGLIVAAVFTEEGELDLSQNLPDGRLMAPDSGLYAQVSSNDGRHNWRSPSMIETDLNLIMGLAPSQRRFETLRDDEGHLYYAFAISVTLDAGAATKTAYTFSIAENLKFMQAEVRAFRQRTFALLGGLALALLIAQTLILRWGLLPLKRVARDLVAIESGQRQKLDEEYPREIRGLTTNINALLDSQREHLDRHRHALSDLAHSLKTPLAVLQNELVHVPPHTSSHKVMAEHIHSMSQIISHQLQRAATSGRLPLTAPIAVAPLVDKIINTLNKVYFDKHVKCQNEIGAELVFHGEQGDLYELLGNLLDNAFKSCRHRCRISAVTSSNDRHFFELIVEDDGPGIPAELREEIFKRGVTTHTPLSGQGIGLATVQDIIKIYGGDLNVDSSPLGGALFRVRLPA